MNALTWSNSVEIESQKYRCGYCGSDIATQRGWQGNWSSGSSVKVYIAICHQCTRPTFIEQDGARTPGSKYGQAVKDITDPSVAELYDEARRCTGEGCFTAAVLCCRKLLMHIAVSKGAEEKKTFISYVQYLRDNNYISPGAEGWVDHIRETSNEANHEIVSMNMTDAEDLLSFIEMLLRIIYEFPATVARRSAEKSDT